MYKRYYTPFEEQPVKREYQGEVIKPKKVEQTEHMEKTQEKEKKQQQFGFLGKIATDDIILIGILLLLLMEDKENRDMPLILGIAFLLLIEYFESD